MHVQTALSTACVVALLLSGVRTADASYQPEPVREIELSPGQALDEQVVTRGAQDVSGTLYSLPAAVWQTFAIADDAGRAAAVAPLLPLHRLSAVPEPTQPNARLAGSRFHLDPLPAGHYAFVLAGRDRSAYQSIVVTSFALIGAENEGVGWLAAIDRTTHRLRGDVTYAAVGTNASIEDAPLGSLRYRLSGSPFGEIEARAPDGSTIDRAISYSDSSFDGTDTYLSPGRGRYRPGDVVRFFGAFAGGRPPPATFAGTGGALTLRANAPRTYAESTVPLAIDGNGAASGAFRLLSSDPDGSYFLSPIFDRGATFAVGAGAPDSAQRRLTLSAREPLAMVGEAFHVDARLTDAAGRPVAGASIGFRDAGAVQRGPGAQFRTASPGPSTAAGGTAMTGADGRASFAFAIPTGALGRLERFGAGDGTAPEAFVDRPVGQDGIALLDVQSAFVHRTAGTTLRIVGREVGPGELPATLPLLVVATPFTSHAEAQSLELVPGAGGVFSGDIAAGSDTALHVQIRRGDAILSDGQAFDADGGFGYSTPGIVCQTGGSPGGIRVRVASFFDGPALALVGRSEAPDLVPFELYDGLATLTIPADDAHPDRLLTIVPLDGAAMTSMTTALVAPAASALVVTARVAADGSAVAIAVRGRDGRARPATVDVRFGVPADVSASEAGLLAQFEKGHGSIETMPAIGRVSLAAAQAVRTNLLPSLERARPAVPASAPVAVSTPAPLVAPDTPVRNAPDDVTRPAAADGTLSVPFPPYDKPASIVVTAVAGGDVARVRLERSATGYRVVLEPVPPLDVACDGTAYP